MTRPLPVFVSESRPKLAEVERILGFELEHCSEKILEIQAVELEEVIEAKAKAAFRLVGKRPVMVEDTGLFIAAWNGLPGALTRWFLERLGVDGICRLMAATQDRSAEARTLVGVYDGRLRAFEGVVAGRIADRPRGDSGFGWDSIFIPDGTRSTFAEMSADDKDAVSMRRRALEGVKAALTGTGGR